MKRRSCNYARRGLERLRQERRERRDATGSMRVSIETPTFRQLVLSEGLTAGYGRTPQQARPARNPQRRLGLVG